MFAWLKGPCRAGCWTSFLKTESQTKKYIIDQSNDAIDKISTLKRNWTGHIARLPDNRWTKRIMECRSRQGALRNRGLSPNRWTIRWWWWMLSTVNKKSDVIEFIKKIMWLCWSAIFVNSCLFKELQHFTLCYMMQAEFSKVTVILTRFADVLSLSYIICFRLSVWVFGFVIHFCRSKFI